MKIHGGCHCGGVSYEAEIDPAQVIICHCTDCQRLSGSAFRTVVFAEERNFRFLGAEPKVYLKMAESGRQREQTFCPECGSPIYSAPVGQEPRTLGIRVGTVDQRDQLVPRSQCWTRSAQKWLGEIPAMESVATQ